MTFKSKWEKTHSYTFVDDAIIKGIVSKELSDKQLERFEIIVGGCANLNIKLFFEKTEPLILRIYIRDKEAAYREQRIAALIKKTVPVPQVYIIGDYQGYRYAIIEYMQGVILRDLILNNHDKAWHNVMYETGTMLAAIAAYQFDHAGFFDSNLKVMAPYDSENYVNFMQDCLRNQTVVEQLGDEKIAIIATIITKFGRYFPNESHAFLVHADYDPANILVDKIEGQWKITAILDWEFSFSGSWLWDVSNMLRYAHELPHDFKTLFIQGVQDAGLVLPEHWEITVKMLNLMALLDSLTRCSAQQRPKQLEDICNVIDYIIKKLSDSSYR